jgi:hypothetical protein
MPDSKNQRDAESFAAWSDLWIDVDGGWFLAAQLGADRRVGVATDPHIGAKFPDYSGERMRKFTDRVYMMQSPYCAPGDGWLPYGFDPEWHKPAAAVPDFDVTNLGACYPERIELSVRLRAAGMRVLGPERATIGPAYAAELRRAPVAVVWPLADDLPCRVFEAAACGVFVVTRDVPDLDQRGIAPPPMFCYRARNLSELITFCCEFPRPCTTKPEASAAFRAAHSWDARLAQLVEGRDQP